MEKALKEVEKINAPVEGMTCASCVARVEKAISKLDGVKNVSVNFASEKASFEFDPELIDYTKISQVVEDAGYKINFPDKTGKTDKSDSEKNAGSNDLISEHEKDLKRNFILSVILAIPVLLLSMGTMWDGFRDFLPLSTDYLNKILLILTTPVIFIPGKRFFKIFWTNLKHFSADMNSLVAVGTGAAYIFSTVVTLFPDLVLKPGDFPHVYFDTAAVIIALILMGRWLEAKAKTRTNTAIKKLMGLKPKSAIVKRNGNEIEVKLEDLKIGDIVVIKPGGKIPADGKITSGSFCNR